MQLDQEARRVSSDPSQGGHTLEITIRERVGGKIEEGRNIFAVEAKLKDCFEDMVLPSFVIKIASANDPDRLKHEAYVYNDLRDMQGCDIPICYGLFKATVKRQHIIENWGLRDRRGVLAVNVDIGSSYLSGLVVQSRHPLPNR